MRALAFALFACAACGPRATPSNVKGTSSGISISLYRSADKAYGVVDDRRWVEVSGSTILLGNIDPGAALASLVIESSNPAVRIGPCTRMRLPDERDARSAQSKNDQRLRELEQKQRELAAALDHRPRPAPPRPEPRGQLRLGTPERFAPIVQCDVAGPPGRQLVRIVYVSTQLSYRVQHEIAVRDPSTASIESRYTFVTPSWRERAEVAIFDGLPGGVDPPRELVRGHTTLDGGTSILGVGAHDVPAQVRRIFSGATFEEAVADDYGTDLGSVWATLEIPEVKLSPGPMRVHVELDDDDRWIDLPETRVVELADPDVDKRRNEPLRIKLWADEELRGTRQRVVVEDDGTRLVEVIVLSMTNSGSVAREVWLEEHARLAKRRSVERAWPKKPSARGDVLRNKLVVKPGATERTGYTLVYEQ